MHLSNTFMPQCPLRNKKAKYISMLEDAFRVGLLGPLRTSIHVLVGGKTL